MPQCVQVFWSLKNANVAHTFVFSIEKQTGIFIDVFWEMRAYFCTSATKKRLNIRCRSVSQDAVK